MAAVCIALVEKEETFVLLKEVPRAYCNDGEGRGDRGEGAEVGEEKEGEENGFLGAVVGTAVGVGATPSMVCAEAVRGDDGTAHCRPSATCTVSRHTPSDAARRTGAACMIPNNPRTVERFFLGSGVSVSAFLTPRARRTGGVRTSQRKRGLDTAPRTRRNAFREERQRHDATLLVGNGSAWL
mmetsp:Transcript_36493/g.90994  ORF Transcript_36493/g.90994 Transcript_36493/m.90994 type:complete len:183 (+) Transcript_36493:1545-2093(+)